MMVMMDRWNVE